MVRRTQSKNFIKRLFSSRVFLFFIALALIWLGVSVGRESYRKYQLTKEINSLKSEIERLETGNQQLSNLIEFFKQESYLEKEARLKLNLRQPGEKVVIVPRVEEPATEANSQKPEENQSEEPAKEKSNWWQWWEYFFERD